MKRGFTIVELLIVIVVIGILAALVTTSFSHVQDRARYSQALHDLTTIRKALLAYQAQNGSFPQTTTTVSANNGRYSCQYASDNFIPELSTVASTLPAAPCTTASASDDTWWYGSNGDGFKLLYLRANVSDGFRDIVPSEMRDTRWPMGTSWGYWTEGWENV